MDISSNNKSKFYFLDHYLDKTYITINRKERTEIYSMILIGNLTSRKSVCIALLTDIFAQGNYFKKCVFR